MSKKLTHLLWVDLETTGLRPDFDLVLEVGAIYTDLDLTMQWEVGAVFGYSEEDLDIPRMNPAVVEMHTKSGLFDAVRSTYAAREQVYCPTVYDMQSDFLDRIGPDDVVALAGSGVAHFDRDFLRERMPRVFERLEYYVIDVGIVRRSLEILGGSAYRVDVPASSKDGVKAHRGPADVYAHLEEARRYKELLFSLVN